MRSLRKFLLAAAAAAAMGGTQAQAATPYSHVLLLSVDGLHAIDLQNWLLSHPGSALSRLSQHGVTFPNAFTTAPSDSFPGMSPKSPAPRPRPPAFTTTTATTAASSRPSSGCVGQPGAETTYAENIDVNQNLVTAGGILGQPRTQIDPAKLPQRLIDGRCGPVYPHEFIRANTVFEIIKAAGLRTAWCDKHPAYEILNGPSGHGIDDLFTPEINSLIPARPATTPPAIWRPAATTSARSRPSSTRSAASTAWATRSSARPAIMGMNFQAVSVGEKLAKAGYATRPASPAATWTAMPRPATG